MSEHFLPDDLARWPKDPNELLGVTYGVTPRDLRRAYNRLIRIYKPERFPEQFRRIREAYENLLRIAEWFAPHAETSVAPPADEPQILPAPQETPTESNAVEWTAVSPQPVEETNEEEVVVRRRRQSDEDLDELWQEAIAGHPTAAYERLVQLTQQYAGRTELYLRLYWLRTLFPEVDERRVPADWLVQGLLATGLSGSLRELYRQEISNNPEEALSKRYKRLLETPLSIEFLADSIEWRFQAAARLERWDVPRKDFSQLRPRFGLGQEQLWLRLVFSLADDVAWAGDSEAARLLTLCCEEIARHEYLASKMAHFYDRFELILEASAEWRALSSRHGVLPTIRWALKWPIFDPILPYLRRRIPSTISRLLGALWPRPLMEVREPLWSVLEAIACSPQRWLDSLDALRERAPSTLALFGELLDRFEEKGEGAEARCEADALMDLVLPFLASLNVVKYQKERNRLLLFCLREAVLPEEMAEAAGGAWAQVLNADWPLRYVCRACRLFWA